MILLAVVLAFFTVQLNVPVELNFEVRCQMWLFFYVIYSTTIGSLYVLYAI